MRKLLGILFVLLLLPSVAWGADTCTSNTDFIWDGFAETGWTCTGGDSGDDAADAFVIASGHVVIVSEGNIAVTTGSVTVQSGGTLRVDPGNTLQFGASLLVQVGGWLDVQGSVIDKCRITKEVDWSVAGSATATLDCSQHATANATDWIVFGDDDPAGPAETLNRRMVQVGPGPPEPGVYRPSFNKWAWYDITAESGATVTYDLTPTPGGGYSTNPYAGTRGIPSATAYTAANLASETPDWLGLTSSVTLPTATLTTTADFGSLYLAYAELLGATKNDPAFCSGKHAKILHTVDGGVGVDTLYVAGDISECAGSGTAFITPGARRGDPVYIVRPAILSGDNDADGIGDGYIHIDGGRLTAEWATFTDIGFQTNTVPTPDVRNHANILITQGGVDGSSTNPTGYIANSQVLFAVSHATQDTNAINFSGAASSTTIRYPTDGVVDLSDFALDRVYTHDAQNSVSGAGVHGLIYSSVKNANHARVRSERNSDDGIGAPLMSGTNSDSVNSITLRQMISTENLDALDNSQQCFETGLRNGVTSDGTVEAVKNSGAITVTDILATGCYGSAFIVRGVGTTVERIVVGGVLGLGASESQPVEISLGSGGSNAGLAAGYPTSNPVVVKDSFLGLFTSDTNAAAAASVNAKLQNTILVGGYQPAAGNHMDAAYLHTTLESVIDMGAGETNGIVAGGTGAPLDAGALTYTDSLFRATGGDRFTRDWANEATTPITFTHVITMEGACRTEGTFVNPDIAEAVINLDGWLGICGTPHSAGNLEQGAGTVTTNVCMETGLELPATVFAEGAGESATTLISSDLQPATGTASARLRGIVRNPNLQPHPCNDARPRYLGLRTFGVAHSLLGDFTIEQNDRLTSGPPLIGIVRGGSIQSGKSF